MVMQGAMTKVWVVKCGACGTADTPPGVTRAEVEKHMRQKEQWRKTKERGWICRWCDEQRAYNNR